MLSEKIEKDLHKESYYYNGKLQDEIEFYLKPMRSIIKEIKELEENVRWHQKEHIENCKAIEKLKKQNEELIKVLKEIGKQVSDIKNPKDMMNYILNIEVLCKSVVEKSTNKSWEQINE